MSRRLHPMLALALTGLSTLALAQEPVPPAYSGRAAVLELPEISVIVNGKVEWSEAKERPLDGKVRIDEVELGLSGGLFPGVRGDVVAVIEQEYEGSETSTEMDLEEAYLTFQELPGGFQATLGRRLIPFGRTNPNHPHHWDFADSPLALRNLFGDHPWFDDGAELSWLVPNPGDLYIKLSAGVWNGRELGHHHGEEDHHGDHDGDEHEEDHQEDHQEEHHHGHLGEETIEWEGHVFTGRLFLDLPLSDRTAVQVGGSAAIDEHNRNTLLGADFSVLHRWPDSFRTLKWQTELTSLKDRERDSKPRGLFSSLRYQINKNWVVGGRYDWTELLEDDHEDASSVAAWVTYYLTHSTYVRAQVAQIDHDHDKELLGTLQLVWGIGPHSHRLQD